MSLLIILLVMRENGMFVPAWAMWIAWTLLVIAVLGELIKWTAFRLQNAQTEGSENE